MSKEFIWRIINDGVVSSETVIDEQFAFDIVVNFIKHGHEPKLVDGMIKVKIENETKNVVVEIEEKR